MPWLRVEIELVRPEVMVCFGATAGQALLGKGFSVMRERDERHEAFEHFVADLKLDNDAERKPSP